MVGHVRRRIAEYGDESGRAIPVTPVQESASPEPGREPALE
ncbi:protein of unknown function [Methanoculleus bourgensis]|nr:protein of unknown function [Methanoculleus bourgensis]